MPDAPVSAPAAPAAAPAQTQVSPPASAAPSAPAPAAAPDNPYAELDALNAADPAPSPSRKKERRADPPSESARGADGKFTRSDPSKVEPDKTGTPPASGNKTEAPPAPTAPLRTAELRARYDETKTKLADLEPKLAQAERELAELRGRPAPDTKPLETELATLREQNAALQEEIRFVNYQKHPEFAEKYQRPYLEAWNKAVGEIEQLSITMEDGSTRKATANDFLALANAPLDQLDDLAAQWFPKAAARVIRHVEKMRDLAEAQEAVLAEARKGAGAREQQMAAARKAADERVGNVYRQTTADLAQKFPKWFAPEEGDAEGNEILRKGFEYADSVLNGSKLPAEEKAKRLAIIRAKAASHDRLASRLKSATARIRELEADLAEYEKSAPAGGEAAPGGDAPKDFMSDAMAELASLDK